MKRCNKGIAPLVCRCFFIVKRCKRSVKACKSIYNWGFTDNFVHMKPFILFGSVMMIIAILITGFAFINQKNELPEKHVEVVLRTIGDQLLRTVGDTSSRVLPVKKINESTYQIAFQNQFGFVSDTLINLVQRTFKQHALAKDYIVNLRNCKQNETVFAFEINSRAGDLTPCRGRKLDVDCYVIDIELLQKESFSFFWWWLLVIPLGVVGYYVRNRFKKSDNREEDEEQVPAADKADFIPLGSYQFYPANNVLKRAQTSIPLSDKETKALSIFAANINEIVERETLMKELWEEEGIVVISRNVDVLVSKLRKKFSEDERVKFVNVHGRGYRFLVEGMG